MLWHSLPIRSPTNSFLLFNYSEHKPQKQLQSVRKTKENKTKAPPLSLSLPFSILNNNHPRYQCQYTSDKRQTRNITITGRPCPYAHHRALSLTQASLLGHIVKGHHQHNRHAVATKTDVKLKKKQRRKSEAKPNQNETMRRKRAYKLMKDSETGQDSALGHLARGYSALAFHSIETLEWMNPWMKDASETTTIRSTWAELDFFITRTASVERALNPLSILRVCVPTTIIICSVHTHTHAHLRIVIGCRGPSDTHKRGKNEEEEKKWVRKPMEQPAPST